MHGVQITKKEKRVGQKREDEQTTDAHVSMKERANVPKFLDTACAPPAQYALNKYGEKRDHRHREYTLALSAADALFPSPCPP